MSRAASSPTSVRQVCLRSAETVEESPIRSCRLADLREKGHSGDVEGSGVAASRSSDERMPPQTPARTRQSAAVDPDPHMDRLVATPRRDREELLARAQECHEVDLEFDLLGVAKTLTVQLSLERVRTAGWYSSRKVVRLPSRASAAPAPAKGSVSSKQTSVASPDSSTQHTAGTPSDRSAGISLRSAHHHLITVASIDRARDGNRHAAVRLACAGRDRRVE